MSWSWSNPTPEEAQEAYSYYKRKYNQAASQKRDSERQEQEYLAQKDSAARECSSLSTQRLNFEKRLSGIQELIKMLEGSGGWFSLNVPEVIAKAQKSLAQTDASFRSSVILTDGIGAADLCAAYETKTVAGESHSASALAAFRAEKTRLEQEILRLKERIAQLSALVDDLNRKVRNCNATQSQLRSAMNSYAYDMNHYKRYID